MKRVPQYIGNAFDLGLASLLALLVFVSRYLTRGEVYYVDGPILVQCILNRTYVIQPPGYWLFAHLGGLFPNPAFGLLFVNQIFSATGVAVFFLLCRKLNMDKATAFIASLCYASVFFLWLAGDVHSSYASQVLFPPLLVYLFLGYRDRPSTTRIVACAIAFSFGAGLRPSDGLFLAPLLVFLAFTLVPGWPHRLLLATVSICGCLAWYLPGRAAARAAHIVPMGTYIKIVGPMSLLISGIEPRSIANVLRVVLPFLFAFWPLLPTLFFKRSRFENGLLFFWILPGLLFFLFIFVADPVYFTFLTAAVILCAALTLPRARAIALLLACAFFNMTLFLFAKPIRGNTRPDQAINFYVLKYTYYGIQHKWKSTIQSGAVVPR